MAATPAYFLLSLSMPAADEVFLKAFSTGLFEAADEWMETEHNCKNDEESIAELAAQLKLYAAIKNVKDNNENIR